MEDLGETFAWPEKRGNNLAGLEEETFSEGGGLVGPEGRGRWAGPWEKAGSEEGDLAGPEEGRSLPGPKEKGPEGLSGSE